VIADIEMPGWRLELTRIVKREHMPM